MRCEDGSLRTDGHQDARTEKVCVGAACLINSQEADGRARQLLDHVLDQGMRQIFNQNDVVHASFPRSPNAAASASAAKLRSLPAFGPAPPSQKAAATTPAQEFGRAVLQTLGGRSRPETRAGCAATRAASRPLTGARARSVRLTVVPSGNMSSTSGSITTMLVPLA